MKSSCVDNADAALQALQAAQNGERPFDLAVLDYMMPGCDGFELGRRIASDERLTATRLVLLTSAREIRCAADFEALGFAAYLLKPVSHRDLRECLAASVGGRFAVAPADPAHRDRRAQSGEA
jgi:CheY-like chemotaxis protein